jgi:hypothetical protein
LSMSPVEKIHIYQAFHIDRSLLAEDFAKLTVRPELLKLEEAEKLGIETMLQISQARELSRGSSAKPSPIQVNNSELRSVIKDAFGLEEDPFIDFLVGDFFSFMRILLMFSVVTSKTGTGQSQPPGQSNPPASDTGGRKNKK